jgi:hypothetical protein
MFFSFLKNLHTQNHIYFKAVENAAIVASASTTWLESYGNKI